MTTPLSLTNCHSPEAVQLLNQISQFMNVPTATLKLIQYEIQHASIPWQICYSEYQSSGWKTAALLNTSGLTSEATISDGLGRATPLLSSLPTLEKFLRDLGLSYMCVRLARFDSNAFLWEHIDYTELNNVPKLRLHLPIVTNSECRMVFMKHSVHMASGYLWKLDPRSPHGACNQGYQERTHLLLDCYVDERLKSFLDHQWLDECFIYPKQNTSCEELIAKAYKLARLRFFEAAERTLLKMFFTEARPSGESYDHIIRMHQQLGNIERSNSWAKKKRLFLYNGIIG